MQKFLVILAIMVFGANMASAASAYVKAGINTTKFYTTVSDAQVDRVFGGGINFEPGEKFSIAVEVQIAERAAILRHKIIGGANYPKLEYTDLFCSIRFAELPILLKYQIFQHQQFRARAYTGLHVDLATKDHSYGFNKKFVQSVENEEQWQSLHFDYEYSPEEEEMLPEYLASSTIAPVVGLELHWQKLFVDVRYLFDPSTSHWLTVNPLAKVNEGMHTFYFAIGLEFPL